MGRPSSVEAQVCAEHQRLLEECEKALKIWDERRAEFCQFRSIEKAAGDQLLLLQTKYARAYTVLQNHERNCSVCQLALRVNGPFSENSTNTSYNYEVCT
jgi:hypothetical protein